jgi:hypothetical protein
MQENSSVFRAIKNSLWVMALMAIITITTAVMHLFAGTDPGWIDFLARKALSTVIYGLIVLLASWGILALGRKT